MAQSRLRGALRSLTALRRSLSSSPLLKPTISPSQKQGTRSFLTSIVQSRPFRAYTTASLSSLSDKVGLSWSADKIGDKNKVGRFNLNSEGGKLTIELVFETCDYNHWWIGLVFPSDGTPVDKLRICEEVCAKVLDISLEEAKQKIYAYDTSTNRGFQAAMTKEESDKFVGLPHVAFVLPDPFQDPDYPKSDKDINEIVVPSPLNDWSSYHQQDILSLYNQQNLGTPGRGEGGGFVPMNHFDFAVGGREDSRQEDGSMPMNNFDFAVGGREDSYEEDGSMPMNNFDFAVGGREDSYKEVGSMPMNNFDSAPGGSKQGE